MMQREICQEILAGRMGTSLALEGGFGLLRVPQAPFKKFVLACQELRQKGQWWADSALAEAMARMDAWAAGGEGSEER